jgi:hypothetical protein
LLRIVRDLRRVHSHLASFAYPVVGRSQRTARPPSVDPEPTVREEPAGREQPAGPE